MRWIGEAAAVAQPQPDHTLQTPNQSDKVLQTRNAAHPPLSIRLSDRQHSWLDAEANRSGQASRAAIIRRLIDQAIAAQKTHH